MPWTDYIWTTRRRPDESSSSEPATPPSDPAPIPSLPSSLNRTLTSWSLSTGLPLTVLLPTLVLTTSSLAAISLYKSRLRRIPTAPHIPPSFLRNRSLYGYVTSVGDGDNFRLFHTPGGRLAGWGWLPSRRAHLASASATATTTASGASASASATADAKKTRPSSAPKKLDTIHVRVAGVDAPELAHFGRPAQEHGRESLAFLKDVVLGRYVRVYLYRKDQYERVVASVYVSTRMPGLIRPVTDLLEGAGPMVRVLFAPVEVGLRVLGWMWNLVRGRRRTDVALRMLEEGAAGVYEARFGSEFGGEEKEKVYRAAEEEAKRKGVGMWGGKGKGKAKKGWWASLFGGKTEEIGKIETPREFKTRMKEDEGQGKQ
ncbi:hypothetical protein CAC42_5837 [Sphaceloma murrayae]|uniref:Probable endonuclease LCL3 n=1 Tax=Sphaceloma murrayae TaxID=2082308 RepID=A0A2K1QZC2_9PEZI|nr:hypothetical protein CAC42_5837 [Sphaceloma murrayae]